MITELQITDPTATPCLWWPKVSAFEGRNTFKFNPTGLTILWGPNGSGKSTLLKILARLTHCEQGGTPLVTEVSVREFVQNVGKDRDVGVSIKTDGQPVHFLDPGAEVGIIGGSFDYDFGSLGIETTFQQRLSAGEKVTARTNRILTEAAKCQEVPWKVHRDRVNEVWRRWLDVSTRGLESNIKDIGPPTLLLDEPTRSLGIPRQAEAWRVLGAQVRFQIIAATHSVFALNIPEATYIDVVPGYLEECRAAIREITS